MTATLYGMIACGFLVAAAYFFRFWRMAHDVLFLIFGLAFLLLAFNQFLLGISAVPREDEAWLYVPKLLAFALLIAGIIAKNRHDTGKPKG